MFVNANKWNDKTGCPGTQRRTYNHPAGMGQVRAHVTREPNGHVWYTAWRVTGRDHWGNDTLEIVTQGSLAPTRYAVAVAKNRVSRTVDALARRKATAHYQAKIARAIERMDAARALLDTTDLTDYRTLAARQDELVELTAELDHLKHMLTLAA